MGRTTRRSWVPVAEPMEGRRLLSYLVVPRKGTVVPVHVSDARSNEPLHSNGLAVKKAPQFANFYTGPHRPDLNGVRAQAYVAGSTLVLSGTVVGPIVTRPATSAQGAAYTFAIDRGGASQRGPFPGREHIRFDTVVVAEFLTTGPKAYLKLTNALTNQPDTAPKALPASSVSVQGATITIRVPMSLLPSSGHAMNQWNVNFYTQNLGQKPGIRSVASLTPEFTEFQVAVTPPKSS